MHMKIVKKKISTKPLLLRVPEDLVDELDKIAKANDMFRQELVIAILTKALSDRSFTIEVTHLDK